VEVDLADKAHDAAQALGIGLRGQVPAGPQAELACVQGWKKPGFLEEKKPSPVFFFVFFYFLFFWFFYVCPEERVFRVFQFQGYF
jgi:hypothetical protein